jgi:hypothetical protein
LKKISHILIFILLTQCGYSQVSANFIVNGDVDKYYPVRFFDGGWSNNTPTNLTIGRSSAHTNENWRGSLMAIFSYHVTSWGNSSQFIDADIKPSTAGQNTTFIAGWQDVSHNSAAQYIIIWLRGGGTTYYCQSNYAVNATVYDGVQNALPYTITNGGPLTFKTSPDEYATTTGSYQNRNAFFTGNVGIGTINPDEKLTVKGKIHAQEIKVDLLGPLVPDYVFADDYKLKSLQEVEEYIKENNHLPEIPSAQEIEKNGLMLAEMNMSLLKKIEEMTLYMIEMKKENEEMKRNISELKQQITTKK